MARTTPDPLQSLVVRLGVVGARIEARYAQALAHEHVRPKHVVLLGLLQSGTPGSQLELAASMGVAPSLVVALADDLVALGAVDRERDEVDRRRQRLVLTSAGRHLLDRCGAVIRTHDAEIAAVLAADEPVVARALERLAVHLGFSSS